MKRGFIQVLPLLLLAAFAVVTLVIAHNVQTQQEEIRSKAYVPVETETGRTQMIFNPATPSTPAPQPAPQIAPPPPPTSASYNTYRPSTPAPQPAQPAPQPAPQQQQPSGGGGGGGGTTSTLRCTNQLAINDCHQQGGAVQADCSCKLPRPAPTAPTPAPVTSCTSSCRDFTCMLGCYAKQIGLLPTPQPQQPSAPTQPATCQSKCETPSNNPNFYQCINSCTVPPVSAPTPTSIAVTNGCPGVQDKCFGTILYHCPYTGGFWLPTVAYCGTPTTITGSSCPGATDKCINDILYHCPYQGGDWVPTGTSCRPTPTVSPCTSVGSKPSENQGAPCCSGLSTDPTTKICTVSQIAVQTCQSSCVRFVSTADRVACEQQCLPSLTQAPATIDVTQTDWYQNCKKKFPNSTSTSDSQYNDFHDCFTEHLNAIGQNPVQNVGGCTQQNQCTSGHQLCVMSADGLTMAPTGGVCGYYGIQNGKCVPLPNGQSGMEKADCAKLTAPIQVTYNYLNQNGCSQANQCINNQTCTANIVHEQLNPDTRVDTITVVWSPSNDIPCGYYHFSPGGTGDLCQPLPAGQTGLTKSECERRALAYQTNQQLALLTACIEAGTAPNRVCSHVLPSTPGAMDCRQCDVLVNSENKLVAVTRDLADTATCSDLSTCGNRCISRQYHRQPDGTWVCGAQSIQSTSCYPKNSPTDTSCSPNCCEDKCPTLSYHYDYSLRAYLCGGAPPQQASSKLAVNQDCDSGGVLTRKGLPSCNQCPDPKKLGGILGGTFGSYCLAPSTSEIQTPSQQGRWRVATGPGGVKNCVSDPNGPYTSPFDCNNSFTQAQGFTGINGQDCGTGIVGFLTCKYKCQTRGPFNIAISYTAGDRHNYCGSQPSVTTTSGCPAAGATQCINNITNYCPAAGGVWVSTGNPCGTAGKQVAGVAACQGKKAGECSVNNKLCDYDPTGGIYESNKDCPVAQPGLKPGAYCGFMSTYWCETGCPIRADSKPRYSNVGLNQYCNGNPDTGIPRLTLPGALLADGEICATSPVNNQADCNAICQTKNAIYPDPNGKGYRCGSLQVSPVQNIQGACGAFNEGTCNASGQRCTYVRKNFATGEAIYEFQNDSSCATPVSACSSGTVGKCNASGQMCKEISIFLGVLGHRYEFQTDANCQKSVSPAPVTPAVGVSYWLHGNTCYTLPKGQTPTNAGDTGPFTRADCISERIVGTITPPPAQPVTYPPPQNRTECFQFGYSDATCNLLFPSTAPGVGTPAPGAPTPGVTGVAPTGAAALTTPAAGGQAPSTPTTPSAPIPPPLSGPGKCDQNSSRVIRQDGYGWCDAQGVHCGYRNGQVTQLFDPWCDTDAAVPASTCTGPDQWSVVATLGCTISQRTTVPANSSLLNNGTGITNGAAMSAGNFQVEGYCNSQGLGINYDTDTGDWFCLNSNGTRALTLKIADYDKICQQTYQNYGAFAIQSGTTSIPAFNWRCFAFTQ